MLLLILTAYVKNPAILTLIMRLLMLAGLAYLVFSPKSETVKLSELAELMVEQIQQADASNTQLKDTIYDASEHF